MNHVKGFALALCAIVVVMVVEVMAQPVRGMMWTENDQAQPVAMAQSCPGFVLATGLVSFTDYNIEQGYFEISEFQGQMRPDSTWLLRVKENRGKPAEIVLRIIEPRTLEGIKR